jgi:hypothetical protein
MVDLRLPDQRTIGKEPRVWTAWMRGKKVLYDRIIILIGMVNPRRVWTRVVQRPMDLGHEVWCECHLPSSPHEPSPDRGITSLP